MKTDPCLATRQPETIAWRSSERPPWLRVWTSNIFSPLEEPIRIDGRASKTTPSFFKQMALALGLEPSENQHSHDWETFIPWMTRILERGHQGRFYVAIDVQHAEDLFLCEANYAREMGRFLHLFVRMNKSPTWTEGSNGWLDPPKLSLHLHYQEQVHELFVEQVMEAMAEAF